MPRQGQKDHVDTKVRAPRGGRPVFKKNTLNVCFLLELVETFLFFGVICSPRRRERKEKHLHEIRRVAREGLKQNNFNRAYVSGSYISHNAAQQSFI